MRPTVSQYAEALEILSKEGMSVQELTRNFLGFLKRRGDSDKAVSVMEHLEKRVMVQAGVLSVTVVTAHEVEAESKLLLVKQAERIFPGKTVTLKYEVDATVIGGARFRADEALYDATVLAQLNALKEVTHK